MQPSPRPSSLWRPQSARCLLFVPLLPAPAPALASHPRPLAPSQRNLSAQWAQATTLSTAKHQRHSPSQSHCRRWSSSATPSWQAATSLYTITPGNVALAPPFLSLSLSDSSAAATVAGAWSGPAVLSTAPFRWPKLPNKTKDTPFYHCSFCPLTPLECDQCAAADASLSLVAVGTNQSLGRTTAAAPLLFTRVGSLEGLPYSNVLSLALSPSPASWPKAWVQYNLALFPCHDM